MGQFEPGSPISRLGREPDWQAMVIDHLKMNAGPATFGAQVLVGVDARAVIKCPKATGSVVTASSTRPSRTSGSLHRAS